MARSAAQYRIGVDENGLGARLGPLVVTAVLARVTGAGARWLEAGSLDGMGGDLGDSKVLVSHADSRIGEAWARVLAGGVERNAPVLATPADVLVSLSLEGTSVLTARCPVAARDQCWGLQGERFLAGADLVDRVRGRAEDLAARGVEVVRVLSSIVCTAHLNEERAAGHSRFVVDLHAMERLVLSLREVAGAEVTAVCGKVGGIGDYPRFFGPLQGCLHTVVTSERARAAYRFPGLGELRFVMDADAQDALVMLASLVGKYVREMLMARIGRYYVGADAPSRELPSGYHDPRTERFVVAVESTRERREVPRDCFERER
ncbi:MAG: hypothetical protein JW751_11825 [Polyangiaceae bacterium]|nr:hypothetical protein [Polyangiaceae bacterium]